MAFQSTRDPAQGRLLLLTAVLFVSYLCVAMPLPIVPVYVTEWLGLSNVWAGLGVGIAFFATVVTRGYAGSLADRIGAKVALARGLGSRLIKSTIRERQRGKRRRDSFARACRIGWRSV